MGDGVINARISAVSDIANGLAGYERALGGVLTSARSETNRIKARFQLALVESQRRLRAAEGASQEAAAALAACREGCEGLAHQLSRARAGEQAARQHLDMSRRAEASFDRAASELLSAMRTTEAAANERLPIARRSVQAHAETLTDYLRKFGSP